MEYTVDDAFIARFERMKQDIAQLQQMVYGDGGGTTGARPVQKQPYSTISVKVATLISVANVTPSGYVVYQCNPADTNGNYSTNKIYVWTRPDVSVGDIIQAVHMPVGIKASGDDVLWKQPGADLSSPFKVYLTQNGGSNGTKSSACSYTYDVYFDSAKASSSKIGSTLAPQWRYLQKCPVTAATIGLACYVNGAPELQIAYETLGSNGCS